MMFVLQLPASPLNEVKELELFGCFVLAVFIFWDFHVGLKRKEPGKKDPLLKNSTLILTIYLYLLD